MQQTKQLEPIPAPHPPSIVAADPGPPPPKPPPSRPRSTAPERRAPHPPAGPESRSPPHASVSEKIELKLYSGDSHLVPPDLGREGEQLGQQHRHHRDVGRQKAVREAGAPETTASSPSLKLARTAATKRGREDDSEKEQAEVREAAKKPKHEGNLNSGGGQGAPQKSKIGEKLLTIKEKIANYNRQSNPEPQQAMPRTTRPRNPRKTTTQQQQQSSRTTTTTRQQKKTTRGMEGQHEITTLFKKQVDNNKEKKTMDGETTTTTTQLRTTTTPAKETTTTLGENATTTTTEPDGKQEMTTTTTARQATTTNKKQQYKPGEANNKQQQITKYLGKTTTTNLVQNGDEQQQHEDNEKGGKQQQQQLTTTTKLTIKVKGQQVGDLKEYLARKKLERAAKGKSLLKPAGQPEILGLWRTQSERFGEDRNLANTDRETVSAAKGKL